MISSTAITNGKIIGLGILFPRDVTLKITYSEFFYTDSVQVLNALNNQTIIELNHALDHFDSDSSIAAIVITGCEKAFAAGQTGNYEFVKVETAGEKKNVGIVTLNRPKVLNALNNQTIIELNHALDHFDSDSSIAAIVITGCEKAFAAGGDLQEINLYASSYDFVHSHWDAIAKKKKPLIAAVNGYVVGGASEIAMMCDIIYAGEKSKFTIPDVIIGIVSGAGGTQRLPRVIGKSKAMEMVLTGKMITAQEAERSGLCSKVFPVDKVVEEAVKLGEKIASHSPLIVSIAKKAVNAAYETTLQEGLLVEKSLFHSTFCLEDRKEGMTAFLEKRPPKYKNQ